MRVPAPQTETLHFGLFISEGTLTQSVSEVIELAPRERSPYGNWETVAFDATSQTWEAASWNQTLSRWENADQEPIPAASVTWQATHVGFPEYYDAAVRKTISLSGDERSETQHEYISRRKFGGYAIMELPLVGDYVVTGGFSNYIKVWNDADFADAFINSVLITGLTILGQTIFSILAAYAFARIEFPGKNILFMLFLMTIFIPFMVILIPNVITVTNISNWSFENIGPIFDDLGKNIFLFKWVGLDATDARWMGNWPGLVVIFWTSTFSIFLLRQFFVQIPTELWDAAQIDGAGHLRFLFQIVVPISRAAIMTTVLFTFISTWNLLEWPIIVTQKSTEWKPIAVALYEFQSDEGALPNLVMSGAMISLLPVIIIYLITQKQFTEGIATTGLKG
jgi:ABC-type glycerol-3-phosphate transport system permease component